jgi:hypothetical protein
VNFFSCDALFFDPFDFKVPVTIKYWTLEAYGAFISDSLAFKSHAILGEMVSPKKATQTYKDQKLVDIVANLLF